MAGDIAVDTTASDNLANGTSTVPVQLADAIATRLLEVTGAGKTITIACSRSMRPAFRWSVRSTASTAL